MIRVLLADDHAMLRHRLQEILANEIGELLWGEAEDGRQVLERLEREPWDLLILDVAMPGGSGLDVLKDVRRLWPKLPILMLSTHPEDQYGRRAFRAGASGYMNKEAAPYELVKAVRRLLAGGRYASPALAETLASSHDVRLDSDFHVLLRIAVGRTVSQIAADLGLTVPTVMTCRARILEKLRLSSTAELIVYAIRNQLVD